MRSSRTVNAGRAVAVLTVLLLIASTPLPAAPPAAVALSGTVKDTLGNFLPDVEILLVQSASTRSVPAAVTHSDPAGRFRLPRLVHGTYRLAAIKEGYLTFVGQVDTVLQQSVELVLHPTEELAPNQVPDRGSWAMRIPRRGILREVDAPLVDDGEDASRERRLAEQVSVQFEQLFSVGTAVAERDPESTEVEPTTTRMQLASSLGDRGNLQVQGWKEKLGSASASESVDTTAMQQASAVRLGMSYDTSPGANLAINAFFNQTDYELSADHLEAPSAYQQEQRTWGYDASWSKQLDPTSRVAVQLDYQDTSMVHPLTDHGDDMIGGVTNRAVAAQGSYESVTSERHEVQVAVRAQRLEQVSSALLVADLAVQAAGDPFSTWSLHAEAQDTWSVTAPFALVYGLGYRHALMDRDSMLIVPKVGGALTLPEGWTVRALVSYHAVAGGEAESAGRGAPFLPRDPLGYEAEVGVPLAREVRLTGGMLYSPIQLDYVGYVDGVVGAGDHPLYLTDGNSAVREHRLAIVEDRGPSTTYLEVSNGRVEGTVAPMLPFGSPLQVVSGQSLRYMNGRMGVRLPTRGTDILMEYRMVQAESDEVVDGKVESTQQSVELRVRKNIGTFRSRGLWRLLLALKHGTVESDHIDEWSSYGGGESIDALNRRVSAGVSVVF